MRALFAAALIASQASAHAEQLVPLDPAWRVLPGDHPDCGDPALDDDAAVPIDAYARRTVLSAAACFRATASTPATGEPLGLALGAMSGAAYRIWADGAPIAANGDVATGRGSRGVLTTLYTIPATAGPRVTIAIQIRTSPPDAAWHGGVIPWDRPQAVLGPRALLGQTTRARLDLTRLVVRLVVATLYALLGVFHLLLFYKRRQLSAYLFWALSMLSYSAWMTYTILEDVSSPITYELIDRGAAFAYLVCLFSMEGTWRLVGQGRMPRHLRALQLALVACAALHFLALETFSKIVPYTVLMAVIGVAGLLGIVVVLVMAAWRGDPEARTLVGGAIIVIILFTGETVADAVHLAHGGAAELLYSGTEIGFVIFSFAMVMALANRFSRSLEALDATNRQLQSTYDAAARFVPTDLLRILGHRTIQDVRLGDQVATQMSTLFCDLRGFSTLAEKIGPPRAFELINEFLRCMEPEIYAHGGLIVQYLGDGIMALFPGDPDDAVRAGIAMHAALARFNAERGAGDDPLAIGIGVNTGLVMVGTIGGVERLGSSVIGDAVNVASRLEGMTKLYGAAMLVGERTAEELGARDAYSLRELDRVVAKGKTSALSIYEVLDVLTAAERAARERTKPRYAAALAALKRGAFEEAATGFAAVAAEDPGDRAASVMSERAAELAARPPEGWVGATLLATK
jgi:class 3 adenylate cyclase